MSHSHNKEEVKEYFINKILGDQFDLIVKDLKKEDYNMVKKRLKFIEEDLLKDHIKEMKNYGNMQKL